VIVNAPGASDQGYVTSLSVNGPFNYSTGPVLPQFDPSLNALLQGAHVTTFQNNINAAGVNPLLNNSFLGSVGYNQGFSTGTVVNGTFNETRNTANSLTANYNPFTTGSLSLTIICGLFHCSVTLVDRDDG